MIHRVPELLTRTRRRRRPQNEETRLTYSALDLFDDTGAWSLADNALHDLLRHRLVLFERVLQVTVHLVHLLCELANDSKQRASNRDTEISYNTEIAQ